MAKKTPAKKPASFAIEDTAELLADGANPRKISDDAAGGLRNSLRRFGDLSGIVFNRRTGELVCGHQRMQQIRAEYGDRVVEVLDEAAELGCIRIDPQHVFPVRVVDWSTAKQRAANVAANSPKIAGQFTDDLTSYLLEVQADLQNEEPGTLDECLLSDLLDIQLEPDDPKNVNIDERYQVVVELESEEQQREVHELLTKKGWKCRVLTV